MGNSVLLQIDRENIRSLEFALQCCDKILEKKKSICYVTLKLFKNKNSSIPKYYLPIPAIEKKKPSTHTHTHT